MEFLLCISYWFEEQNTMLFIQYGSSSKLVVFPLPYSENHTLNPVFLFSSTSQEVETQDFGPNSGSCTKLTFSAIWSQLSATLHPHPFYLALPVWSFFSQFYFLWFLYLILCIVLVFVTSHETLKRQYQCMGWNKTACVLILALPLSKLCDLGQWVNPAINCSPHLQNGVIMVPVSKG